MGFRFVPKFVTLVDLERHNSFYFALFHRTGRSGGGNFVEVVATKMSQRIYSV